MEFPWKFHAGRDASRVSSCKNAAVGFVKHRLKRNAAQRDRGVEFVEPDLLWDAVQLTSALPICGWPAKSRLASSRVGDNHVDKAAPRYRESFPRAQRAGCALGLTFSKHQRLGDTDWPFPTRVAKP